MDSIPAQHHHTPICCRVLSICGYSVVSVNLHISVCSARGASPPGPSDLWLSTAWGGGARATPAKVADASLCTDEECLMRKGWDPDKFTQGGWGEKRSSCCSQCWFIMVEDIYCLLNYCLCEWQTELLPYSSLKRNTAEFDPYSCCSGGSLYRGGFVREKFVPHPNLVFASSAEDDHSRIFKDIF